MKSVVILSHRVPFPPNKGEKLRTFHQIEYLHKHGYKVSVCCPVFNREDEQYAIDLAEHFKIEVSTLALGNQYVRFIKAILTGRSMSEANFYSAELETLFLQKAESADAVLLTASSLTRYARKLVSTKTQVLIDFMDVDSDKWAQYVASAKLPMKYIYARENKLIRKLELEAVANFDHLFLIAEAEVNLFEKTVSKTSKLKVLGNGIDFGLYFPVHREPKKSQEILFTGVMDYKPNIDAVKWFVSNCWKQIKEAKPNCKFIIGGMNPTSDILALKNIDGVEVTGFVDDIKPYFDSADLFVAPFQIARGVQNKVLQAMACALPVVSTSLGAEGINCIKGENILISDQASDFTASCLTLLTDENAKKAIGEAAHQLIVNHYSWDAVLLPLKESIG
ncbi:TIGR03087 family PEP-CTERM/XrtA system glycosyltransferase [Glaciecola sp. 1036]|uniref:TIGR03087 family PEP-CTERM/XrtA system glycosyltransferase n=1 Tax=Alteromonadaceae TaxID=72275 RepID=UPI003D07EC14